MLRLLWKKLEGLEDTLWNGKNNQATRVTIIIMHCYNVMKVIIWEPSWGGVYELQSGANSTSDELWTYKPGFVEIKEGPKRFFWPIFKVFIFRDFRSSQSQNRPSKTMIFAVFLCIFLLKLQWENQPPRLWDDLKSRKIGNFKIGQKSRLRPSLISTNPGL